MGSILRASWIAVAVLAVCAVVHAVAQPLRPFEVTQVHMGLPVRILLHAADERRAESGMQAAFARIAALDGMMSDYRPDSELRRLEAGREWTRVSPELLDVLTEAVSVARATGGAFDPTVGPLVALWRNARETRKLPSAAALEEARTSVGWQHLEIDRGRGAVRLGRRGMRLDLGGIAKGYILQQALRTLRENGLERALIEAGGDIVAGSSPPGRPGWRIDAPEADEEFRTRASQLTNAALATSGPSAQFVEIDGVRYSHVVDPRTGLGLRNAFTAHVIAGNAATADALATALTVLGPSGVDTLRRAYPGVFISLIGVPGSGGSEVPGFRGSGVPGFLGSWVPRSGVPGSWFQVQPDGRSGVTGIQQRCSTLPRGARGMDGHFAVAALEVLQVLRCRAEGAAAQGSGDLEGLRLGSSGGGFRKKMVERLAVRAFRPSNELRVLARIKNRAHPSEMLLAADSQI